MNDKSRGIVNNVLEVGEAASECCVQFWSSQLQKDIDAMERVQRRATRSILGQARLSYEERLKEKWLYTRERRRLRGDMIETFKILKDKDKISADELFNRVDSDRTRDHSLRVKKRRVKTVARQGSSTQRGVNAWNGLPGKVVAAETVDKFKLELDRYLDVLR